MMTRLVANIFYSSLSDGLDLFVTCLGFKVLHQDATLAVIERDGAKAHIVESAEFAAKDRPQITIETEAIDELYREIQSRAPQMLHRGARQVSRHELAAVEAPPATETWYPKKHVQVLDAGQLQHTGVFLRSTYRRELMGCSAQALTMCSTKSFRTVSVIQ